MVKTDQKSMNFKASFININIYANQSQHKLVL